MPVSPPRPKGPPLNALRAFEAAARLGGFAAAADELCVTPGAVSQHVKTLESWAGSELFQRRSQGVLLTPLGESVLADFSTAFDRMGEAVQFLRARAAPNQVRIATLPSLAQIWLSPRLPAVRKAVPDLELSITALETPPNLKREPFDLCIFFENRPLPEGAISLGCDVIFPVCAPSVAKRLRRTEDLDRVPWLRDASWSDDWETWIEMAAPALSPAAHGPLYSLYSLALEEAVNGAGVLIGHEMLVRKHLQAGTLVEPFGQRVTLERELTITISGPVAKNRSRDRVVDALLQSR